MKKTYNKKSPAVESFEQYCQRNFIKPTNMKADCYIAGYWAGYRGASNQIFEVKPDELDGVINQVVEEQAKEKLVSIRDGYKVSYEHYPYPIERVTVYKYDEESYSLLVRFHATDGYHLFHLNDCDLVPF